MTRRRETADSGISEPRDVLPATVFGSARSRKGLPQEALVDQPGEIRDPRPSLEYRPGNAEDGLRCAAARLAEEAGDGAFEAVVIGAGVDGLCQGPAEPPFFREEAEVELGAPDVAG